MSTSLLTCVVLLLIPRLSVGVDTYDEELFMSHLPDGSVLSSLRFSLLKDSDLGNSYNMFPMALGDILRQFDVCEFHLSITQGFWRHRLWGYTNPSVPSGAELVAWFEGRNASRYGLPWKRGVTSFSVDQKWKGLIHALTGLFCASLSQINSQLTVAPHRAHRMRGVSAAGHSLPNDSRFVRYGVLPSENVCTENLTPWKKLLPCKSNAGLSSLLNPLKLYSTNFHSLTVDVRRICPSKESCRRPVWELTQTVNVVFEKQKEDWKLSDLYGARIVRACNICRSSFIVIDTFDGKLDVVPTPSHVLYKRRRHFAVFDVKALLANGQGCNIGVRYNHSAGALFSLKAFIPPPLLSVHCHVTGSGQAEAALVYQVQNASGRQVRILLSHLIPWFLRLYYHTMRLRCADRQWKADSLVYYPAQSRLSPHYLEMSFAVPAFSHCDLAIEFDKAMLRWTEYPPDAHHGFHVPAPLIMFVDSEVANHSVLLHRSTALVHRALETSDEEPVVTVVYGEVMLVTLPTPDFSMPYNVICLVCTVVALAFGPIHNLTTKRFKVVKESRPKRFRVVLQWLTSRCRQLFRRKKSSVGTERSK